MKAEEIVNDIELLLRFCRAWIKYKNNESDELEKLVKELDLDAYTVAEVIKSIQNKMRKRLAFY